MTGSVKINYSYPTLLNPKDVRYNEYGTQYDVQILKGSNGTVTNGVWQSANWINRSANDCSAVWPDRNVANLPLCDAYFKSQASYVDGEYFSARVRLPDNKYSCLWTYTGAGVNGNESILRGIGTVEDTAGGTYCTVKTSTNGSYRMQDIYGIVPGKNGSTHIEFTLFYNSNQIKGRIWDVSGNVINPIVSGFQIKKIRNDGTSTNFFAPFGDAFLTPIYSWPAFPYNEDIFKDYFRPGEKVGFSLPNPNNAFRCGWILDSRPGTNTLKSSFADFGAGFNPEDLNTYPAEWLYLKRGISETCIEQSGRAVLQTGPGTPLYENNLYVFRLEKKARVSLELKMNYPYLNGSQSNEVRSVAESEIREPFPIETGTYYIYGSGQYENWTPARVYNENSACWAKYPNNLEGTSGVLGMPGSTCNAYYVSNLEYKQGSDYLAAVRFKYRPGKYNCTWSVTTTTNGVLNGWKSTSADGQWEYCTSNPFPVIADDTGTKNITTNNWPTHVTMNVLFDKGSITNTVFEKTGVVTTAYPPRASLSSTSGPYTSGQLMTSSAGHNYYLLPYNNGNGWATGTVVYVSAAAPSSKSCYGLTRETSGPYGFATNIDAVATVGDWGSLGAGFNPAVSAPLYSSDCSGMPITVNGGDFYPALHNQFYTFVVPKLQIGPSTISVVNGSDLCDELGDPITAQMEVSLHNISQPSEPIMSLITTSGYFDFLNMGLKYTDQYTLGYTVLDGSVNLSSYGICPSPDSPAQSNPMNINFQNTTQFPQLSGYPNISDSAAIVDGSIKFYKKDSNKWWQVYNGGVYTGTSSLTVNSTSTGEGMPVDAVLVGDASGALATFNLPNYHGHQLGYVGALISANKINPDTFNRYGLSGKDWGINTHTNKMTKLDLRRVYTAATASSGGWKKVDTLADAINDSSGEATLIEKDTLDVSSPIIYTKSKNKIIMVSNNNGNSTVNIKTNISKPSNVTDTAVVILLVRGDVVIDPAASELRMVIYATGTIRIPSYARDTDLPLFNGGALYSDRDVIIERDLPDDPVWEKFPAVKNAYTPEIFNKMDAIGSSAFPSVLTESKVYWVIEE